MYAHVTKVGQGHPKLLLMQRVHWTHQAIKCEVDPTSRHGIAEAEM